MTAEGWGGDSDVAIQVVVSTAGPLDPQLAWLFPGGSFKSFNLTSHADVNYVRSEPGIAIRRGRSDEFEHFQAGACSLVLRNNNREFDPSNTGSPFFDILRPRRQLVVVAYRKSNVAATFTVLFTGYIEGWPQTWTATTGSVELVAHDLLSVLAQSTTSPSLGVVILDDPLFGQLDRWQLAGEMPQQSTGQRIGSLIGLAGVTSNVIATGVMQMAGVEPSGDVLALCQEAESVEAGFLFVDRQGSIVFLDRHSRFRNSRLGTIQATFTDSQYSGLQVDYTLAQMWNDVRCSRQSLGEGDDPMVHTVTDDTSISEFGRRVHEETLPFISEADAEACALFFLDRYHDPQQRPTPITIKPRKNMDVLFLQVARRELLDRIQIVRTPLGIPPAQTFTGLIEQLEHRITNTEWDCTIGISPIDVDEAQNYLILDDATLGQLNQELLAY